MGYDCIVLTYDAPHRKTYDTLCMLKVRGYSNVLVWAVPMHYKKKFKPIYEHRPQTYDYMKPEILAKQFGFTYYRAENYDNFEFDCSIPILVCGAGIIPDDIIKNYNVINAHPGYIPLVRGLDALKWAIIDGLPIGVTTHLLGDDIDAGEVIERKIIEVSSNDTFHSVAQRLYETEIVMLVDAIKMLSSDHVYMPAGDNILHKRMPAETEEKLMSRFEEYKDKTVQYILFGAGDVGKRLLKTLGHSKVAFFCDSAKAGMLIDGVKVISINELMKISSKYIVVISVERRGAVESIIKLLENNSIPYITLVDALKREEIDLTSYKHSAEFEYWKDNLGDNARETVDNYYRDYMLSIAEESDEYFLEGKIVADFGCGPRGSLSWIKNAKEKIGIDVLAEQYLKAFGEEIIKHDMLYVTSTEKYIPIPDDYVDCVISLNSLDHVQNLEEMCLEIKRILKPSGLLLGSFNLFEPITGCEPQTLTEDNLKELLLKDFNIDSYRLALTDEKDTYKNIRCGNHITSPDKNEPCVLWVRGRKKVCE